MTVVTARSQAPATPGGPAESGPALRPSVSRHMDRWTRYGVWLVIAANILGDRRFQAGVIVKAIGVCAVASTLKNNQARPVRRAISWYEVRGHVDDKVRHAATEVAKPAEMLEARISHHE